jgi:hypothetical protein
MLARLSDGSTGADTRHARGIHADTHPIEWSVLPDSWPDADVPLLPAREVVWVTVAIVAATVAVLLGLS